ncbi:MAG: type II toxin-antitoxin system Phd/YefM family antitoxin [Verrucomicrobia bacterium]|nr:type II toxin-antitoxin system Phd/YefM family antitoxin [Verrucomicrobiota bacterium]
MIEATATDLVRSVRDYLDKVQHGETVQIRRNGKAIARLVPDSDFMSGKDAARLFASYKASEEDKLAADAIEDQIRKLDQQRDNELAH